MRAPLLFALSVMCLSIGCESAPPDATQSAANDAPHDDAKHPADKTSSTDGALPVNAAAAPDTPANPILGQHLLTADEVNDGWISLFDGQSLFGWTNHQDQINWHVEEGAIVADDGPIGLLVTTVPFADFELVCEYQMEKGGNSGVFIRTIAQPKDVQKDCYEINIADEHPDGYLTGSIVGHQKADKAIPGSGDWQTLRITAKGKSVTVAHNGQTVLEYAAAGDDAPRSGLIGLQKNQGRIAFRKVNLKPLGLETLFDGKSLSGWREVPGSKSNFEVEDETIHVTNGLGFLETEKTFGDFIFQAQARTNSADLNSGYFFRAMPGTEDAPSNGYELQIHNGYKDGNRDKPANAGTGAIFRRVEARRVVSNDNEWFTSTLVAAGPRIAVWIDGYQVVAWEDTREPDENPRKGQRLKAGHISLQGHDPTTDVAFRNLAVDEYPTEAGKK